MLDKQYAIQLVRKSILNGWDMEQTFTFYSYCLPDARYHAENWCKQNHIKISSKMPVNEYRTKLVNTWIIHFTDKTPASVRYSD